jgi:glycogen operon protein
VTPGLWRSLGEQAPTWPGRNWPLGATWTPASTNFAIYAPSATDVWLCLYDDGPGEAERRFPLTEQSLGIWHGALPGIAPGTRYAYRVDGPWDPAQGLRFNPHKVLLDPYGLAVSGSVTPGPANLAHDPDDPSVMSELDSAATTARSVVVDTTFDWGDDEPIQHRWRDTVIYELHVKGFTQLHDRIPEDVRGTYAGLGHPVVTDYLRDLGVSAVELLPVQQFVPEPFLVERGLTNYWGYNTIGFFAPHAAYAASGDRGQQVVEFKQMVRSLHAAGIEVILDVVYNHTAEAGPLGPSLSFRGFDDRGFYRRSPAVAPEPGAEPAYVDDYWDVTGCGNTVNTEDPLALRLILDSLRYWVTEMHVDGFRFDLMSALTRTGGDEAIRIDMACKLLTAIGQDPVLRHVKLIAEPWDTSMDGYLVGQMPPPWVEWNDKYRDTVRDFWRTRTPGMFDVATRLAGSSDLYADDGRSAYNSVNFVTAHDGFTVRDLVSYEHKHNEANGEDNRDGTDNNRSQSFGVEGETDDETILAARRRQAANLMATLCLSNGVPMLVAGDERGRTQRGNNNAYCQDSEISWVDWRADDAWLDVYEITKTALRLRREHPALRQRHWFEGRPTIVGGAKDLAWLHPTGREMTDDDWHDVGLQTIGMFVSGKPLREPGPHGEQQLDSSFLVWFHAGAGDVDLFLPDNDWVHHGVVALSTDPSIAVGTPVAAGESLTIGPRSVLVMQEVD